MVQIAITHGTTKGKDAGDGITLQRLPPLPASIADGGGNPRSGGGIQGAGGVGFGGGSSLETQGTLGTESTGTGPDEVVLSGIVIEGLEEKIDP